MKFKLFALLAAFSLSGFATARADDLAHRYNYFDFGWERTSFQGDPGDYFANGHGLATEVMVSPRDNLLFHAEYHLSRPEDATGEGIAVHDVRFGVGGYVPIGKSKRISFYGLVGPRYLKAETDDPEFDPADWGLFVEPGFRFNVTGNFELYAAYEFSAIYDTNFHAGKIGALLNISPTLGIEAFARLDEEWSHSYGAGVRVGW
ncbi:MAG: outer membrane beta-barrel protein [Verrucomicrobiae bacterium]|nr:outer membrane beta-barrel protein [Verrucomicrobiae bacterium]MCP5541604.1 outer membrane beta-barrel protein [Akkermansiaceae bacterium]